MDTVAGVTARALIKVETVFSNVSRNGVNGAASVSPTLSRVGIVRSGSAALARLLSGNVPIPITWSSWETIRSAESVRANAREMRGDTTSGMSRPGNVPAKLP